MIVIWVQGMLNLLSWICRDMHSLLPWICRVYCHRFRICQIYCHGFQDMQSLLSSVWLHMQAPAKQTTAEKNLAKINRTGIKPLSSFFKKKKAKGT